MSQSSIETEIKVRPSPQLQIKLINETESGNLENLIRTIQGAFGLADYSLSQASKRIIRDVYFDTSRRELCRTNASLRVRDENGCKKVTAKVLRDKRDGVHRRQEDEFSVTDAELIDLRGDAFRSLVLRLELPATGALAEALVVENERRLFLAERGSVVLEIALDKYRFRSANNPDVSTELHIEIEVEAKTVEAENILPRVRASLGDLLAGFVSSLESKYEQGVREIDAIGGGRGKVESSKNDFPPTLVLFVHGLGGDARGTWGGFPGLLASDPDLQSRVSVDFYKFPTSLFRLPFSRQAPRIQDLAAGLKTHIDHCYPRHPIIVLVCHSLGGLIARRYLIDECKSGRQLPISGLLLFAVPNNGAGLASVAQRLSWRHAQLRQLCTGSDLIDSLNEDWFVLGVHNRLPVRCIVGGMDRVVDGSSATTSGEIHTSILLSTVDI